MAGSDNERSEHASPSETASGEATPATPTPAVQSATGHEPSAAVTPQKTGKAKSAAKGKAKASNALKRVEDVLDEDTLSERVKALKAEQAKARAERAALAKEIRNTERRKSRLRKRAKQLTDEDLLQVLMMRKSQREAQGLTTPAKTEGSTASASGLTEADRP